MMSKISTKDSYYAVVKKIYSHWKKSKIIYLCSTFICEIFPASSIYKMRNSITFVYSFILISSVSGFTILYLWTFSLGTLMVSFNYLWGFVIVYEKTLSIILSSFLKNLFLIGVQLLYNIVLVSTVRQWIGCKPAHLPSLWSFPPPSTPCPAPLGRRSTPRWALCIMQ